MRNSIVVESLSQSIGGKPVLRFRLTHDSGMEAEFLNYGVALTRLTVPDAAGQIADVVLSAPLSDLLGGNNLSYFGAVVGRVANRINGPRFDLDGTTYTLPASSPGFQLHGGPKAWSERVWDAGVDGDSVHFRLHSPDGDGGFPGAVLAEVRIRWTPAGGLRYDYSAVTDAPTVINLTTHPYFNLAGHTSGPITDHLIQIEASQFVPTDVNSIPFGHLAPVEGTPMDLRGGPIRIGDRLPSDFPQMRQVNGFDHTFVIDPAKAATRPAARVVEPRSGRWLEIHTDQPGVQFYTANHLNPTIVAKDGTPYVQFAGLCLETQHFPDAPNQPTFPSTVLRPGQFFKSWTEHRFGW
jgi:aldose 1-epimerase